MDNISVIMDKFSLQLKSNKPKLNNISSNGCFCDRPKSHVLCKNCGWFCEGRIRYPCPLHLNIIFINDYNRCPKCGLSENQLAEF